MLIQTITDIEPSEAQWTIIYRTRSYRDNNVHDWVQSLWNISTILSFVNKFRLLIEVPSMDGSVNQTFSFINICWTHKINEGREKQCIILKLIPAWYSLSIYVSVMGTAWAIWVTDRQQGGLTDGRTDNIRLYSLRKKGKTENCKAH